MKPVAQFFKELDCQVPVGDGLVRLKLKEGKLETFFTKGAVN